MPDDSQVDRRENIEALRRELDARTAERDEALAERALPLDGGGGHVRQGGGNWSGV
jgi:hypothetical protein